jgi:hypothetical protein
LFLLHIKTGCKDHQTTRLDVLPAIVKVNHGNIEVLDLTSIPHSQVSIPNEPNEKAIREFEPQRVPDGIAINKQYS